MTTNDFPTPNQAYDPTSLVHHLSGKPHTWAVILVFFPFGILTWVWLFIVAQRARRPAWRWFGVAWLAITISQFVLLSNTGSALAGLYIVVAWIGGIIVAFTLRAHYEAMFRPTPDVRAPDARAQGAWFQGVQPQAGWGQPVSPAEGQMSAPTARTPTGTPGWTSPPAAFPPPAAPPGWTPPVASPPGAPPVLPAPPAAPAVPPPPSASRLAPRPESSGNTLGTVVMVCFILAMVGVFVLGLVNTVQAVQNGSFYHARTCAAATPRSTRGCVHVIPVALLGTAVHYNTTSGAGTSQQLNVDIRNGDFAPQVVLNANANWTAIRSLPKGSSLLARYYNGSVMQLQLPNGTRVATEDAPRNQLTFGIVAMAVPFIPVVGMLTLYLIFRSSDPTGETTGLPPMSPLRRHVLRVVANLLVVVFVVGFVAWRGYVGGWRNALLYLAPTVVGTEVILFGIRSYLRRRHANRANTKIPESA